MTKWRQWLPLAIVRPFRRSERGMTLIEIIVALGILAAVAVVFLLGITTSSKAVMTSRERVSVDSLAKSQLEFIKSQPYDADMDHNPPQYQELPAAQIPDGYDIAINAERLDPKEDGLGNDDGLQQVTIAISYNGEQVFTLSGYKVNQ